MTRREIGVCQSSGFTVYYSLNQSRTLGYLSRDGGAYVQPFGEIDQDIKFRRSCGDRRVFIAVIEGGFEYLRRSQAELSEPDVVVFVSSAPTLHRLGVRVVDETWSPSDPHIDLHKYI